MKGRASIKRARQILDTVVLTLVLGVCFWSCWYVGRGGVLPKKRYRRSNIQVVRPYRADIPGHCKQAIRAERSKTFNVTSIWKGRQQYPLAGETKPSPIDDPSCTESTQLLVLLWPSGNRPVSYYTPDGFGVRPHMSIRYCKKACVRFVGTLDDCLLDNADMVIFNFDFFNRSRPKTVPARPRPDVVYVLTSIENSNIRPRVDLGPFNLFWSYHKSLIMRTSWMTHRRVQYELFLRPPLVPFSEREPTLLGATISHCSDPIGRGKFLRELRKYMPVHNYGACFRNRPMPSESHPPLKPRNGKPLLSYYKFLLLIENSLCTDHVSEKFGRALEMSSVPVVASLNSVPQYDEFSPSDPFFVNVLLFKTVAEVAAELNRIGNNKELYNSYLSYREKRREDLKPGFRQLLEDRGENSAMCRVAKLMKTKEGRSQLSRIRLEINESCLPGKVVSDHFKIN